MEAVKTKDEKSQTKEYEKSQTKEYEKSQTNKESNLRLASMGIIYTSEEVTWQGLDSEVVEFKRYQQEYRKAYERLAKELEDKMGANIKVGRYGLAIEVSGESYLFSKDYKTGKHLMSGANTTVAHYILNYMDLEPYRIKGNYLTKEQVNQARKVAIENYIILPAKEDAILREGLMTLSLNRPKDWIDMVVNLTKSLGLEEPKIEMERGDIIIHFTERHKERVDWKFDLISVKTFVDKMCKIWQKDESSNRKPNNRVIRGGGMTLVDYTSDQKKYREYIKNQVEDAISKSKLITNYYDIKFSNTTTSSYLEISDIKIPELKISIRDHERMNEKDYYKFYIDAVGREDFSNRLARVIDTFIEEHKGA